MYVNPLAPGNGAAASVMPTNQRLNEEDFLSLLITELANQDPMDPLADRDFIAQVAQLNTLNETVRMNENLLTMQMLQAASLIGRQVEAIGPNGERVEGAVSGLQFLDSKPWLIINDEVAVNFDYVVSIK